ncbi:hypothetical protein LWI29_008229 [Acer saccharum]|uniref:PUM-HD domain-containing protein n=1 Tax=Acer saccharum TaxID=4024 RepID=A0AA39VX62_ACESA|nr:hypothetical protein LWI29_008229 [Acer saccharum]
MLFKSFLNMEVLSRGRSLLINLLGRLPLSLQMYGCRVIQKAPEVIELDQKIQLVLELDGHVMRCVMLPCFLLIPMGVVSFRVLEHCSNQLQCQCIADEILESACALAQDQYGNYVTQHVLERGQPHERSQIIS